MPVLPSSTLSQQELAEEGSQYSSERIIAGARERIAYALQDQSVLAPYKFDADWLALMGAAVDTLAHQGGTRVNTQSSARPSGAQVEAAQSSLIAWVSSALAAIASTPGLSLTAPHLAANWRSANHLEGAVQTLVDYLNQQTTLNGPSTPTQLASAGQAAIAAFTSIHGSHKAELTNVHPEVLKLHADEGLVVLELKRLAETARHVLPQRKGLYALTSIKPRGHAHGPSGDQPNPPTTTPTPPTGPTQTPTGGGGTAAP